MTDLTPEFMHGFADLWEEWNHECARTPYARTFAGFLRFKADEAARREADGFKPRPLTQAEADQLIGFHNDPPPDPDAPPPPAPTPKAGEWWLGMREGRAFKIGRASPIAVETTDGYGLSPDLLVRRVEVVEPGAIEALRARAEAAEAELEKERRIVARREETRRKALLRDIDAALAGDLKPLRLRRDLMLAPPVEIVASNALEGGNDG